MSDVDSELWATLQRATSTRGRHWLGYVGPSGQRLDTPGAMPFRLALAPAGGRLLDVATEVTLAGRPTWAAVAAARLGADVGAVTADGVSWFIAGDAWDRGRFDLTPVVVAPEDVFATAVTGLLRHLMAGASALTAPDYGRYLAAAADAGITGMRAFHDWPELISGYCRAASDDGGHLADQAEMLMQLASKRDLALAAWLMLADVTSNR